MKRELLHKFLEDDSNKEYAVNRLNEIINFKSLINGQHTKLVEIIYYESSTKGFTGYEDKYELVAKQGISNMHYLCITKEAISNIGFSSKEYEISLHVFDEIETELKRKESLSKLLD